MRKINYDVINADGATFQTTSYFEAIKSGNHVIKTYLTEIDDRTDKEKEDMKNTAIKRWRKRRGM